MVASYDEGWGVRADDGHQMNALIIVQDRAARL